MLYFASLLSVKKCRLNVKHINTYYLKSIISIISCFTIYRDNRKGCSLLLEMEVVKTTFFISHYLISQTVAGLGACCIRGTYEGKEGRKFLENILQVDLPCSVC